MKKVLGLVGIILASVFLLPTAIIYVGGYTAPYMLQDTNQEGDEPIEDAALQQQIIGALAKEIPVGASLEMLKTQAVIIRTYFLRRKLGDVEEGELPFFTIQEMKNLWQNDFDEIYETYEQAVYATSGEVIYYEKELIEPLYHQESAGYTRGAYHLYGIDIAYLQPVESKEDSSSVVVTLAKEEVVSRLKVAYPDLQVQATGLEQNMQIIGRDSSGYVTKIQIGNQVIEGETFRNLLSLNSSHMKIASQKENLIFEVKGVGHGVGLSQKGASLLATQGKTYQEILSYYFTGITIGQISK
jgi:stage II sporulation protein D